MAALQGSGQISIADLRNHFGDSGDSRMSEFYRGGGRVPSTRTVYYTARDPGSGDYYNRTSYDWVIDDYGLHVLYWNGSQVASGYYGGGTSVSAGGYTYYRSTYRETTSYVTTSGGDNDITVSEDHYGIYRTYPASYVVNINTGVPTSGQIALSNFYGAENS